VVYIRNNIFLKAFGLHLQKVRTSKGFSQAQLAADCNMEISQISRIERGLLNTGISQIYIISLCLEIEPKELFDFKIAKSKAI
jgi:transcriptional regulator with XRE-family HTH domain